MDITLPEAWREFLEIRARSAGLASVEEYVRQAVLTVNPEELQQEDVEGWLRHALAGERDPAHVPAAEIEQRWHEIEAELLCGLHSGPAVEATADFWAERRRVLADRTASRGRPEGT